MAQSILIVNTYKLNYLIVNGVNLISSNIVNVIHVMSHWCTTAQA